MVVDKAIGVALWGASFRVWDASSWEPWQYLAWAGLIVAGLELMALLVDKVHTHARTRAAATAPTWRGQFDTNMCNTRNMCNTII
jgi:hypothetical protein